MIRYYCNKCLKETAKKFITQVQIAEADGGKKTYHYCADCMLDVTDFFSDFNSGKKPQGVASAVPSDKEEEEVVTAVQQEQPVMRPRPRPVIPPMGTSTLPTSEDSEKPVGGNTDEDVDSKQDDVPTSDGATEPEQGIESTIEPSRAEPPFSLVLNGKPLSEIYDKNNAICDLRPINIEEAKQYLSDDRPLMPNGKRHMRNLVMSLIKFYRGESRLAIQRQMVLTSQQFNPMMASHCSIHAYARWFTEKEWPNTKGGQIKAGQVLALIGAGLPVIEVADDTGCDSIYDIVNILEYYLGFKFGKTCTDRFISEFGGSKRRAL